MLKRAWLVFALVFCWKVALLIISVQPIPSNDAFFFDGAVSHQVLYGGFYNPSLADAFPILGTQCFSAYPPLYQIALKGWMPIFGVSAFSAITMHVVLIGIYMLIMLAIFRRLLTPVWCLQAGGAFLFLLTFHDRPDTLAHVFGMLAIYAWVRSRPILSGKTVFERHTRWTWLMVLFGILALGTSIQIGTVYFGWVWLGTALACYFGRERFPTGAFIANLVIPPILVLMVKFAFPTVWGGFLQNLHQTQFFTGLRAPTFQEFARVVRTVPGVLLVAALLLWSMATARKNYQSVPAQRNLLVLVPGLLAGTGLAIACLCFLASSTAGNIVSFIQPLIVICFLAVSGTMFSEHPWRRFQIALFVLAVLLGSIRAIGMSTWGVACAHDVSYWTAISRVRQELDKDPPGSKVVISSAFLYEAARHDNIKPIHSDWLRPGNELANHTAEGLIFHKPAQLILTQYDYYRRFEALLEQATNNPSLAGVRVENMAGIRAPDSFKSIQQVLQHISWAPVIVTLTWK